MNFYFSLSDGPMYLAPISPLETLVQCAEGRYNGLAPQYATPCIRRPESLLSIARSPLCQPYHYTGWVMAEVWSHSSLNLVRALRHMLHRRLPWVDAAIPQPQRHSAMVLVWMGRRVHDHESYVEAHRLLRVRLQAELPSTVHVRPWLGNETDFVRLSIDTRCYVFRH